MLVGIHGTLRSGEPWGVSPRLSVRSGYFPSTGGLRPGSPILFHTICAMPTMPINGAKIYYEDTGSGPGTIVFAHGLLCNTHLFDHQVAALKDRYRCIAFDFRGQGQSEVTKTGYDMDTL